MTNENLKEITVTVNQDEPSFSSFGAAVGAATESVRAQTARAHTQLLKGKCIESFLYSVDRLTILLNDNFSLTYWLEPGIVNWAVNSEHASIPQDETDPLAAPQILLRLENPPELFRWSRAEIFDRFSHRRIRRVGACIAIAYLEIDTGEQLWLSRFSAGQRDFLFYDIEDAWEPKPKSAE